MPTPLFGRAAVAVPVQVSQQGLQSLRHVLVAKIPRRDAPTEHRPVVDLRVAHGLRILLRVEQSSSASKPSRRAYSSALRCISTNWSIAWRSQDKPAPKAAANP